MHCILILLFYVFCLNIIKAFFINVLFLYSFFPVPSEMIGEAIKAIKASYM